MSQRATWGRVWYMYGIVHRKGIHLWRKQLYSCPLAGYLKVFVRHGFAFITTVAMTYTVRDDYPSYNEVIKNMWTMLSHTFIIGIEMCGVICLCFCPQNGVYRWLTQNWMISGEIQTKGLWNRPFRGPLGGPYRIRNAPFRYPKTYIFLYKTRIFSHQKSTRDEVNFRAFKKGAFGPPFRAFKKQVTQGSSKDRWQELSIQPHHSSLSS